MNEITSQLSIVEERTLVRLFSKLRPATLAAIVAELDEAAYPADDEYAHYYERQPYHREMAQVAASLARQS